MGILTEKQMLERQVQLDAMALSRIPMCGMTATLTQLVADCSMRLKKVYGLPVPDDALEEAAEQNWDRATALYSERMSA